MNEISTDICVIGGGAGGLSVAAGAVQLGARVVLFEGGTMGGDCLNHGCVPSKALLAAAKAAHNAHGNPAMGITGAAPSVDFAAVKAHVAAVIAALAPHDSKDRFEQLGVTVIPEMARFASRSKVVSDSFQVTAKFFIIATGSAPLVPPLPGLDKVPFHTSDSLFVDTTKPDHLLIIGGGPIGVEMAQAHRRLGCDVTLIEADRLLPRDHPQLVARLRQHLVDGGITLYEGQAVTAVRPSGRTNQPAITLTLANGTELTGSHLLLAVGRVPQSASLNLAAAGINHNRGQIITDRRLRTSNRRVYAIGDVTGRPPFTHMAGYHAGIVIRNCLFRWPARINEDLLPWVTYGDPELAHVGLDRAAAAARYGAANIREIDADLTSNDRAVIEGHTAGAVRAVLHKNGRILGASILAPAAGEMILTWCLAISQKSRIGSIAGLIAPYPTFNEASKRAAGQFFLPKLFSPAMRRVVRFLLRF